MSIHKISDNSQGTVKLKEKIETDITYCTVAQPDI